MIVKITIFLILITSLYILFENAYLKSNPVLLMRIQLRLEHPWWHVLLGFLIIIDTILVIISAFYLLFL